MCVNLCAIEGCTRRLAARGWCHTHYEMWRRKGDPLAAKRFADNSGCCAIDDCDHQAYSKGLCDRHYTRLRRHGNPTAIKVRRGWSLEQRFETDIDRTATSPSCWIWRGAPLRRLLDRQVPGMHAREDQADTEGIRWDHARLYLGRRMSPPVWDQPGPGRKAAKRPPPPKRRPAPAPPSGGNKGCALVLLAVPAVGPLLAWIGGVL